MLRLTLLPLVCTFLFAGCDRSTSSDPPSSSTENSAEAAATKPAPPSKAEPTPAAVGTGAPEMTAEAFYTEYVGETDAMKKIARYEKGITVTEATITSTQDTSTQVIAIVKFDDKRSLRMNFADKKSAKKGDKVSAQCQVNGDMHGEIFLAACTRK